MREITANWLLLWELGEWQDPRVWIIKRMVFLNIRREAGGIYVIKLEYDRYANSSFPCHFEVTIDLKVKNGVIFQFLWSFEWFAFKLILKTSAARKNVVSQLLNSRRTLSNEINVPGNT